MSTLGIGSRVWIGWYPAAGHPDDATWARCRKGVIVDGPQRITESDVGRIVWLFGFTMIADEHGTYWRVHPEGGGDVGVVEWLLHPIDDGDAEADHARRDVAVET